VRRALVAAVLALSCAGAAPAHRADERAVGTFQGPRVPYLPGSVIPLQVNGMNGAYHVSLLGPGTIEGDAYRVPNDVSASSALLVASDSHTLAAHVFAFTQPPPEHTPFMAVACYDDGIVLQDPSPPYRVRAVLAVGGSPGDVAVDPSGLLASGQTDGETATIVKLTDWNVESVPGVLLTDELAFDERTHALYATDRDVNGAGALTRVTARGDVTRRVLGQTAEGLAIDASRRRVYVANVNDGTISIVDSGSMVELDRWSAVDRVFSLALTPDGSRLYAVSNQSLTSPFAHQGEVVAFDVRARRPHVVARSAGLAFPVAAAIDARRDRLFVTDELRNAVYVLDGRTLRPVRAPLATCNTPWKPLVDDGRLYVPCARSNQIDVFDLATLRRAQGAPFQTGGYPLSIAVWHG
jgi:DNA-binding beta-propeller fold protein YncE